MESRQLKNIMILILLLLNLFLLLLVASWQYARHQAAQNLVAQTTALLNSSGISIDPALLKAEAYPAVYSYSRSADDERAFVEALLSESTVQRDNGGGTYLYSSPSGSATFRSNGSFTLEIAQPALQAEDYAAFVRTYCPDHYRLAQTDSAGTSDTVTALPYVDGRAVYSAAIVFSFSDRYLSGASGYFLSSAAAPVESEALITKCSAAVCLMDYCNEEGRICNTITRISTGYTLQTTASIPLLLTPVYRIDTNTYSYDVNAMTGHVSVVR